MCDLDGSELYQRSDDRPETIRARMAQQLGALGDVVDHYRASGVLRTVDGLQAIDQVADEIAAAVAEAGVAPRGRPQATRRPPDARHAQVEGRDREDAVRRAGSSRRSSRSSRRASPPGVSTAELDRLAERHIRGAKGVP